MTADNRKSPSDLAREMIAALRARDVAGFDLALDVPLLADIITADRDATDDRWRAAMTKATAERDVYLAVLEGAEYECLAALPSKGVHFARLLGAEAARQSKQALRGSLELQAQVTALERAELTRVRGLASAADDESVAAAVERCCRERDAALAKLALAQTITDSAYVDRDAATKRAEQAEADNARARALLSSILFALESEGFALDAKDDDLGPVVGAPAAVRRVAGSMRAVAKQVMAAEAECLRLQQYDQDVRIPQLARADEENVRLREAVEECAERFEALRGRYDAEGAHGKAAGNESMAHLCRAALQPEESKP
jgi:hypothetical protein